MKNKLFVLLFVCFFLCGCGNYRELNEMSIITAVAVDKSDDDYKVSFLIANSQKAQTSPKEGESQTAVYSAKGKSMIRAFKKIDEKSPKKIYFGHINVVIISEDVAKEGFLEIADILFRFPETRKQFYVAQARNCDAKDILKIVSPLESFPSQGIATLLKSTNYTQSSTADIDYASFINQIIEIGRDPILPAISISGSKKKGSSEKNLETTEPDGYLKLNGIAVYKDDKFTKYVNFNKGSSINIINNNIKELKVTFNYRNDDVGFSTNKVKTKVKVKSKNTIDISVSGSGFISQIDSKTNLEKTKVIKKLEKKLNKKIKSDLKKTILEMQENETDVFGFGNKIYKKYPKEYDKIKNHWDDKYFKQLNINIKVNMKIDSLGSLNNTIKEVKG